MTQTVTLRPGRKGRGPQPPIAKVETELSRSVRSICRARGDKPDELLEILHDVQHSHGYVPQEALPVIAEALNLSRAEVYGVVTFYHEYRREPAGRHVIKICRAEACQSMGAEKLCRHAEDKFDTELGGTSPDGSATIEAVYCLGNCALSPAIMIDDKMHGRVDEARFDALVSKLDGGRS